MKILLSEYVELTKLLVKNQVRLVDECGYCVQWNGELEYYLDVKEYISHLHETLVTQKDSMELDITIDEALKEYGLL